MNKYPVYRPNLDGNEKKYVLDCLDSTWISSLGKYIPEFESSFAKYIGVRHGASVANGTLALDLALLALGIRNGDEVIVPTFTYIASVNTIAHVGGTPVFVDSLADTWQMDPMDVERKITDRTKAIMVVHLYGHACDMDSIMEIARRNDLFVIEDCAEAIGTEYKGRKVGCFGDLAAFSFFGNKTITTGEGGMVLTDNDELHDRCMRIKGQGLAKHREYWHDILGYNFRMTNIEAAIGLAQLEKVQDHIDAKRRVASDYLRELEGLPVEFHREHQNVFHTYWMCSILVEGMKKRDSLRTYLSSAGIETRPLFYPAHTMPMYSARYARFRVAEDIGIRGLNLPSYPTLKSEEIAEICTVIREFFTKEHEA